MVDLPDKRGGDLVFTDDHIMAAMCEAARSYNSIPPYGQSYAHSAGHLPDDTNLFFNGIAAALFRRRIALLAPEATTFQAGNIQTAPDAELLTALAKLEQRYRDEFIQEATNIKANLNIMACYGRVG